MTVSPFRPEIEGSGMIAVERRRARVQLERGARQKWIWSPAEEAHGEIALTVKRDRIDRCAAQLRDDHDYQQLMEIAGVDWPDRGRASKWSTCCFERHQESPHRVKVNATEKTCRCRR
jgi:NADH:ubiquinone oxidoreductase subunit C